MTSNHNWKNWTLHKSWIESLNFAESEIEVFDFDLWVIKKVPTKKEEFCPASRCVETLVRDYAREMVIELINLTLIFIYRWQTNGLPYNFFSSSLSHSRFKQIFTFDIFSFHFSYFNRETNDGSVMMNFKWLKFLQTKQFSQFSLSFIIRIIVIVILMMESVSTGRSGSITSYERNERNMKRRWNSYDILTHNGTDSLNNLNLWTLTALNRQHP